MEKRRGNEITGEQATEKRRDDINDINNWNRAVPGGPSGQLQIVIKMECSSPAEKNSYLSVSDRTCSDS